MTSRSVSSVYEQLVTRATESSAGDVAVMEPVRDLAASDESASVKHAAPARQAAPVETDDNLREDAPASVPAFMSQPGTLPVHRNGTSQLLAPVRAGLERVEQRLRRAELHGNKQSHARSGHGAPSTAETRGASRSLNGASQGATLFAPLANAFLTLIGSGGKRLRPALALLAAQVGLSPNAASAMAEDERVISLAASVEMLHTSTLVHDDVIDGALLRRGAPTLNALWSGGATVLAGNYMFGTAAQMAAATGNMAVIHLFSDTLNVIVDGELRQLRDRYNYAQPRENYGQRIYAKTASLFCAATQGGALLAGLPDTQVAALRDYGYHLGMAFQIVDDILDFTGDENSLGKPAGSDLRQGTLTLPFFFYLQSHPDPATLIAHLEEVRDSADDENAEVWHQAVREVVSDLRQSPAIDEARAEAQRSLDAARASLHSFVPSLSRSTMLALCDFVLQRTY